MQEKQENKEKKKVQLTLKENKVVFKELLNNSSDIKYFEFDTELDAKCMVIYIEQIVNEEVINRDVIGQLKVPFEIELPSAIERVKEALRVTDSRVYEEVDKLVSMILLGKTVLFVEGCNSAIVLPTEKWTSRSISEPESEVSARGARDGFIEDARTNKSLIRKRIKNANLVFEDLVMGDQTNTSVAVVYINGIVNPMILDEVRKRLGEIKIDGILDSGYIQEMIKDHPVSPFNTVGYTERPDSVAGKLLEGRIAIICDGSSFVLTVPHLFMENLQVSEDYNNHFILGSIARLFRLLSLILTLFTPGAYIALTCFHHEMIPEALLMSFISARSAVPFPTIVEVLIMLLVFDIIRESGQRLPRAMGQTVSIVGALVLGQAAVEARFVSAPVIIIIAITAISSFIFFRFNGAIILYRMLIILLASLFGLYGVIYASIIMFMQLLTMRSFGVRYMSYLASFEKQEVKDTIIRAPWWYMYMRPKKIAVTNYIRKGVKW